MALPSTAKRDWLAEASRLNYPDPRNLAAWRAFVDASVRLSHGHGRTFAGLARQSDASARFSYYGFADREAEAGAAGGTGARGVAAIEAIEDVRQCCGIDAVAMILNR